MQYGFRTIKQALLAKYGRDFVEELYTLGR